MDDVQTAKAPVHLWIVGLLSLLWNGFGCLNYLMSRTHNVEYMRKMAPQIDPAAAFAYGDSMPILQAFGWGLGVWCALLGSLLLLIRSRHALLAFALSLIGALVAFGYQFFVNPPPAGMDDKIVPLVVILIAAGLFFYAHRQKQAGVLR
ncbi:MAG TPA: hypothetical protein VEB39_09155 [Sphingomicrobium sp.]|nr:hypothetical protein [Sphingomicrobium sp.]